MGSMKEPWLVKMSQWSILDLACWYRIWFVFNCMICTCVATCTVHVWQYDHFDICVMFGGYEANHVNLDDGPSRKGPAWSHVYRPVTCLWKPHLISWSSCGVWIYAGCHWIYNAIQCAKLLRWPRNCKSCLILYFRLKTVLQWLGLLDYP